MWIDIVYPFKNNDFGNILFALLPPDAGARFFTQTQDSHVAQPWLHDGSL